jgi:hypothetical protein
MKLIKGFALVILAVMAIAIGYGVLAISTAIATKEVNLNPTIKALPQTRIAGYLMPVREAAAVSVDYSKFTIRELKAMARGTGIKSWEKLRKADLVAALATV